jgi:hypothetical protein
MTVHKDTYMFVTPTFIKQYATILNSGMSDPAYLNLIMNLQSLVERTPAVTGVYHVPGEGKDPVPVPAPGPLMPGLQYKAYGQYLGNQTGTLAFSPAAPTGVTVTPSEWLDSGITFAVGNTNKEAVPNLSIQVTPVGGPTLTMGQFNIAAGS